MCAPCSSTAGATAELMEEQDEAAAEVHHVEIDHAKLHYHAKTDEFYYVIDGTGTMVLDDDEIELHKGVVVYVPRGDCRVTRMRRASERDQKNARTSSSTRTYASV